MGSRQPSIPPPPRTTNGTTSIPPAKKYKADTDSVVAKGAKGKERETLASNRTEPEVDEDVRQMQSEADSLRRQSRAAESAIAVNPAFQIPPPSTNGRSNKSSRPPPSQSRGRAISRETSQPIPQQETPQIERNKMMRADPGHTRRKSSLTRGKRISSSYVNTGVISE